MRKQILGLAEILGEMRMPCTKFSALVASVVRTTSGLVKREIRGRERREHLVQIEQGLLARLVVDTFGVARDVLGPARGDEIGLLPEVEELAVRPVGILEAVVAGLGLDHGLRPPRRGSGAPSGPRDRRSSLNSSLCAAASLAGSATQCRAISPSGLGRLAGLRGHAVRAGAIRRCARRACREHLGALIEQTHHVAGKGVPLADLLYPSGCGSADRLILLLHQSCALFYPQLTVLTAQAGRSIPGSRTASRELDHCAMQYSKGRANSNRRRSGDRNIGSAHTAAAAQTSSVGRICLSLAHFGRLLRLLDRGHAVAAELFALHKASARRSPRSSKRQRSPSCKTSRRAPGNDGRYDHSVGQTPPAGNLAAKTAARRFLSASAGAVSVTP